MRHISGWIFSGDIFGAYRSAHYIAWGDFGSVYAAATGIVTFPGILLLFAPVAALTGHLGMTESFPYYVAHPTAWLVLGPYEMVLGCIALFACDALAQRLGASSGRRALMCVAQGVVLWPVLVFWGHPEDPLAVALAVYALLLAFDDRWTGAGWLLGAAVATQPLVLLMIPVVMALAGRARIRGLLVRTFAPAALLLVTPLIAEFHTTWHVLVDQPNYPRVDHTTPWTFLAPHLGGTGASYAVAGGPGRIVGVLAACAIGVDGAAVAPPARDVGVVRRAGTGHALLHRIRHGPVLRMAPARAGGGGDGAGPGAHLLLYDCCGRGCHFL